VLILGTVVEPAPHLAVTTAAPFLSPAIAVQHSIVEVVSVLEHWRFGTPGRSLLTEFI
jgi:hypothetical protein